MAIYLVDYENVYIEGLTGLEQLGEEDTLHIFYTQNRCGLTFRLYEQLTHCRAKVQLNEVSVSLKNSDPVKNALDIQLMMFTGYLIGTKQTEHLYIVSKDKDFQLGTEFYQRFIHDESIELRIVPSIEASLQPELPDEETQAQEEQEELAGVLETLSRDYAYPEFLNAVQQQLGENESFAAVCDQYATPVVAGSTNPVGSRYATPVVADSRLPMRSRYAVPAAYPDYPEETEDAPMFTVQYHNTVRNLLGKSTDEETVNRMCEIISDSDTLVDLNNGLARFYRDGERAKNVYHKFKPRFEDLRHLSRARNKG